MEMIGFTILMKMSPVGAMEIRNSASDGKKEIGKRSIL